jgi:hypothetical protein
MKYKQQLYFVIGFIALRILMFVLYMFFKPAQPGPYTPYVLFLYTLFDVLILCYLYRFVKTIKEQPFSLMAVSLIVLCTAFNLLIDLFSPFDTSHWSLFQVGLLTGIPNFISLIAKIILAVQLIRNKTQDIIGGYLKMLGWSYVFVMFIGFGSGVVFDYFPAFPIYLVQLLAALPWTAMIIVYMKELQLYAASNHSGSAIDSGV